MPDLDPVVGLGRRWPARPESRPSPIDAPASGEITGGEEGDTAEGDTEEGDADDGDG